MILSQSTSQPPSQSQDTAPIQHQRPPAVSPSDDKPPTSEITITKDTFLTTNAYTIIKDTAVVDITTVMNATTAKGKDEIGQAVATAKATAIRDLNSEYEAIVKEFSVYDNKKAELDKDMNDAIKNAEIAKVSCLATRQDIDNVTSSTVILKDKLKISHEEIDNAYCRKEELGTLIEPATEQMTNLKKCHKHNCDINQDRHNFAYRDHHWRCYLIHNIT